MDEDKLTEEELLGWLEKVKRWGDDGYGLYPTWLNEHRKAYTQLKEMIQQKPTVTREWVHQYAWDIITDYFQTTEHGGTQHENMERRLLDMLKELGVEVK